MDFNSDYAMTINGEGIRADATIEVVNPATGLVFARAPDCSRHQLDAAVKAAQARFKTWRTVSIATRQAMVRKAGDVLLAHTDDLARLFTREQGRPVAVAAMEIQDAAAGCTRCPR